jgi:hypothetical protein
MLTMESSEESMIAARKAAASSVFKSGGIMDSRAGEQVTRFYRSNKIIVGFSIQYRGTNAKVTME